MTDTYIGGNTSVHNYTCFLWKSL